MTEPTDPTTADAAAEHVQAAADRIDAHLAAWDAALAGHTLAPLSDLVASGPTDADPDLTKLDLRVVVAAARDCARMAAELEQLRGDWLTQAAQLNRIAGIVGHALILRACDDATPEEIRLALAGACEDVHGVIGESEATRAQRTERYLVMCANLLNDHVIRERDGLVEALADQRAETYDLAERNEQLRDATLEAAGLLHRLAGPGPCDYDGDGACRGHDGFASGYLAPCPHPQGRRFVETWGTAGVAATAAPDGTGDTLPGERRADGLRDLTKLEGPQRGSQGDGSEL